MWINNEQRQKNLNDDVNTNKPKRFFVENERKENIEIKTYSLVRIHSNQMAMHDMKNAQKYKNSYRGFDISADRDQQGKNKHIQNTILKKKTINDYQHCW